MEVAQTHDPGKPGTAAIQIAAWSTVELEALAVNVKKYVRALAKDRRYEGNQILLRGAILHADIATLIPEDVSRGSSSQQRIFMVEDGRQQGFRYPTIHWAIGRSLLDGVMPAPSAEPDVLLWYRAASAHLLKTRALSEAMLHLARARRLFPTDPDILFDSAYLHERFASPTLQAAADEIQAARGMRPDIGSERAELGRAERFFRQALAAEPDAADSRVRLGRVLGQLGRHQEAVAQIRKAIDAGLTREFFYLAQLFLGREEEMLGNRDAAHAYFERAAKLYPRAQSPHLAASQLARRAGDRAGALRGLQKIAELPADADQREDPWWHYYNVH
jgi:tetratricopeptide (TPR) repeat protein